MVQRLLAACLAAAVALSAGCEGLCHKKPATSCCPPPPPCGCPPGGGVIAEPGLPRQPTVQAFSVPAQPPCNCH